MSTDTRTFENATCTFCGCVCDDMVLTVENNRITKSKNACILGKAWFAEHTIEDYPIATVDGKSSDLETAITRASDILKNARFPIVYGLSDTTCEAQRKAVAIADRIGAVSYTHLTLPTTPYV